VTRWWDGAAGVPIDAIGFGLLVLLLIAAAALVGAGWHFYPRWLPRRSWWDAIRGWWDAIRRGWAGLRRLRLPRWRRPGFRRRRTHGEQADEPRTVTVADDALPDRPAVEFTDLADQLAAQGRFAEAVRERLRGMVRGLVEAGVISHHPEWTVTELARGAAARLPETGPPLQGASRVFSDIWYGQREARAEHDAEMRRYAAEVRAYLATPVGAR